MATENKKIITRIQNRRGLKQDLPKPLRPGEVGFATDTRQIYIGADTNVTTDSFNKTAKYENVIGAKTSTTDIVDNQLIKFQVPHRRYDRNIFDGTTKTYTWFPTSFANVTAGTGDLVFKTGETEFVDLQGGTAFTSGGLTVIKNGAILVADNSPNASATSISSGTDYFFSSGTLANSSHSLTFRTPPTNQDEIGISYYSNVDIFNAITASGDIGTGGDVQGINGFHTSYSIPTYRYLNKDFIRVSGSTGVGIIGLSPKHTVLTTDIKVTPVVIPGNTGLSGDAGDPTFTYNSTLGNIFLSRSAQKTAASNVTSGATSLVVDIGLSEVANFTGQYGAFVTDTTGWADDKVFAVSNLDTSNYTLTLTIPANAVTLQRSVSTLQTSGSNMILTASNTQNIDIGDSLVFLDTDSANSNAQINNLTGTVQAVTPNILVSGISAANADGNLSTVSFITRKSGNTVVAISEQHGFTNGDTFTSSNGTLLPGTPAVANSTTDTYEVTTASLVASNTSFTATPVVSITSARVTPVGATDLRLNNNLSEAITMFNDNNTNFALKYVPGSTTRIYLQESEASSKVSKGFYIHNDAKKTPETLKLQAGEYNKLNSTVKSKLEQWLDTVETGTNLLSNVCVNNPFSSVSNSTWALNVDNARDEIKFLSSEEARNLTSIVNRCYFDTENTDIKGLLNVKTNIEILTLESQEAGDSDQQFSAPLGETIAAGTTTTLGELEVDTSEYDALFVEYSMADTSANTSQTYKRIGTLQVTGDSDANQAVVNDQYADIKNNVSGNIDISASISSGTISVRATNDLQATGGGQLAVEMKFIKRSWTS